MSNDINPSAPRIQLPQPTRTIEDASKSRPEHIKSTHEEAKVDIPDPREVRRQLQEVTDQLNRQMANDKRDLNFSLDNQADRVVNTVKNASGEIVRQIPDVTALRLAEHMEDIKGLLKDEKI